MTKRCRKEGRCPPGRILTSKPQTSGLEVAGASGAKPSGPKAPKATRSLLERAAGEGPISYAEGLARAYQQGDAYTHGDTTFVAGTHTMRDVWDDVSKVPSWGDTRQSHRYKMAQRALKASPQTSTIVGHSLGGSVALEAQKQDPRRKTVTFGAPVWDPFGRDKQDYDMSRYNEPGHRAEKPERYRNTLDPISIFDGSSETHVPGMKDLGTLSGPHSYGTLAENRFTSGTAATENPDGTVSITE
jgi:hypothetical protein